MVTINALPNAAQPDTRPRPRTPETPRAHDRNELLRLVADGDQLAYTNLHDQMSPGVFGLCCRLLLNHSEAEDVTQDVFLEVWIKAARFDPSKGSATGWIYQIAHHRAVDRIRTAEAARRRDHTHADTSRPHHEDIVQHLLDAADAHQLHAALNQLTHRRREALAYAFFTENNYAQASAMLGIPLGTFKSRVRDGLLALQTLLTEAC